MAHLDPILRDLVLTAGGDLQAVDNPTRQAVVLRLLTERGSCFWDLTFGSTLHEMPRAKIVANAERDAEDRARSALRPLLDSQEISALSISVSRVDRNRIEMAVSCRDAGQRPIQFTMFVAV